MPISALAASTSRSAAAMSGRRSSNAEGMPAGGTGGMGSAKRSALVNFKSSLPDNCASCRSTSARVRRASRCCTSASASSESSGNRMLRGFNSKQKLTDLSSLGG